MQRIKIDLCTCVKDDVVTATLEGMFREGNLEEMTLTLRYEGKEASETNVREKSISGTETAGAKALR